MRRCRRAADGRRTRVGERPRAAPDRRPGRRARARLDRQAAAGPLLTDDPFGRLRALGFSDADARTLADHFLDAERRGKRGHGLTRVDWLETLDGLDPAAQPECVVAEACYECWEGRGALGYLTLAAICDGQLEDPPEAARLIVAHECSPTGVLGYWARRLAEGGLVAVLTATSPPRLGHPEGGPKLAGTNPLAIAVPSSDGRPVVSDASMSRATYGDVLAGAASEDELVPFGGEQAHKAFALAIGLQLLVDSLVGDGFGAVMLVAQPAADPVPPLRARAAGVRLPGDG
jgi:LDH2 family malate/lactate/ureidoglycolate dehydrogenase